VDNSTETAVEARLGKIVEKKIWHFQALVVRVMML